MGLGNLKPSHLAALTIAGGLTQGSVFLIPDLFRHHNLGLSIGIAVLLFGCGITVMLKSVSALKDGVQNQQWPPEEIEPVRTIFESPLILVLIFVLFIAWAVLFLGGGHSIRREIGWSLYMPTQALAQLSYAFRLKTAQERKPIDWHNIAPLQSEHWGER